MVELRQLEHFLAVAEELHFTRAARRVNIVQSGLSSSIGALEKELGAKLFVRSTRAVRLTREGEVLLTEARRVLAAAQSARTAVAGVVSGVRGPLTIGIMQSFRRGVTDALAAFHTAHPSVDLRVVQAPTVILLDRVAGGRLDIAFACVAEPLAALEVTPLDSEPMVFACHAGHPFAARSSVTLADAAGESFVDYPPGWGARTIVDAAFTELGIRRRPACEVGDTDTLLDLVAHGLGVAVLPPSLNNRVHDGLRLIPLDPPAPIYPTAIVTPAGATSTAARILRDTVLAHQPGQPRSPA
ncbi:LysR family transcriptional regulator [Frankia sp. AgPm24]|uniref:LysR family transcriptional regulator n=1 Tax=Frankia umida TaxID=573489 RepID=A0ABT0K5I9_9ACTN|nr:MULTISPECIES: LysR family transcriptional regulator [Frankia]MCK9878754.1 LysR family transcriptional regulator [Frankia umida]MCK9925397.1 LysR family transcriptional regulator [Frankia sp. AgPm24]